MKKNIIIAAVIIAALAFGTTSCNKDKARCWKVTTSATVKGKDLSSICYMWCTEAEYDSRIAEGKKMVEDNEGTNYKSEKEEVSQYTTQADCENQTGSENIPLTLPGNE